jgi:NAD(P)-dependent dehydrogenase (short-subunit alcohol dehydrogenase family)
MSDSVQIISNLEPLDVYKINSHLTRSYEDIMLVYKVLERANPNKLTQFIKNNNRPDIFVLILNLIKYPILTKWVYELNIMRYYWNDLIIRDIVTLNKFMLKINYLNKNYEEGFEHLVKLNNQFNTNYNYINKIINKRYEIIKSIMLDLLNTKISNINYDEIIFGSDFVELIGNNNYKSELANKLIITIYYKNSTNAIHFNTESELNYKFPYYYLECENITFKIYEFTTNISDIILYGYESAIFINSNKEILSNAEFYQNLNNNKFYNKTDNKVNYTTNNIKLYSIKLKENKGITDKDIPKCYICKKYYNNNIFIEGYEFLCIECANENYLNKHLKVNLTGNTFLITGGRVKLGYASSLKLLRFGASVVITTRYPNFAMSNYQSEKDYNEWKDRLNIIHCDFTKLNEIYSMLDFLQNYTFNGIINNACQTIKASKQYYDTVAEIETKLKQNIFTNNNFISYRENNQLALINHNNIILNNTIYNNQIEQYRENLNINSFKDIQDIQHDSSWDKKIDEISPEEIVECTLINQIVPTLIINKLKNKLSGIKFIINVTSFEGSFNYSKTDKHPHTNMCKTAMNMLIRTLHEDPDKNLHVYAINPGYVSGVCPQKDKYPINLEDGATRILFPIIKYHLNEPIDKNIIAMNNYKKCEW